MPKKTNKEEPPVIDWKALEADLKYFGYLLPTSDGELEEFHKKLPLTPVSVPEHLRSCNFLFRENRVVPPVPHLKKASINKLSFSKSSKTKRTGTSIKNDYFKKIVLAAEIAYKLHAEPTFGHKKFVKIQYLCEQVCHMNLTTKYGKYAAGPLDPKLMYSIDSEFKKQNWFTVTKREQFGYKYELSKGVENYKKYYSNYFAGQAEQIEQLIELFRKEKSDFCEAVATLFYIWKDYSNNATIINDVSLIHGFYAWGEDKKKFDESMLRETINWMTRQGVVPKRTL